MKRVPADVPGQDAAASPSLASLLAVFGPWFTAPSFRTFCGLACGFLSQAGSAASSMLAGAGLSRAWSHDRAHFFFARAPWCTTKTQPSTTDMAAKLRRVIIAARFKASPPASQHREKSESSAWPGLGRPRRITGKVE
jgi:hypothetical protein